MPRRKLQFDSGEYYHLYNRGAFRNQVFHDRDEYALFLSKWRQHITPTEIKVIAYCLMPNHYHLLVQAQDDKLPQHMQRFGTSFVKSWNRRRNRTGVAFEGEYAARHVAEEEYLLHLSRYIHRNPVTARLVRTPADWDFSCYLDFVGLRNGSLPQFDVILRAFASVEPYRQFVEQASDESFIRHLMIDGDD